MKCKYCNNDIGENDRYCPYCGHKNEQSNTIDINPNDVEILDVHQEAIVANVEANNYLSKRYLFALLLYHLIIYIGASLVSLIVTLMVMACGIKVVEDGQITEQAKTLVDTWTQILTYVILVATTVYFLFRDLKADTLRIKNDIKKILIWALVGLGIMYGTNIILNILYTALKLEGDAANQESITTMLTSSPVFLKIIYSLIIVLGAPLVEELIFRKALFGFLKAKKFKPVMCIVLSALLFGLLHIIGSVIGYAAQGAFSQIIPEFLYGLTYIAMGAIFSYVYYQANENIYSSLVLHVFNNLISIIVLFCF